MERRSVGLEVVAVKGRRGRDRSAVL